MGVNNRQRRWAKQKRGRRAGTARRAQRPTPFSSGEERRSRVDDQMVRELVLVAAIAFRFEPRVVYESRLEGVRGLDGAAGPRATEDAVRLAFPDLVHRSLTVSNYAGWAAGLAAADLASIAVGEALEGARS